MAPSGVVIGYPGNNPQQNIAPMDGNTHPIGAGKDIAKAISPASGV